MRHVVLAAGLVVAPAPGMAQNGFADIEVVARPGQLPPLRDAIDYYRSFCFEAARQDGRQASPESDSDWQALGPDTRRRFGVEDPEASVFGLADRARHRTLLIKVERFTRPGRLVEHRCTLVVIGGDEHAALPDRMSRLFGGPGTERHVGEAVGAPALPGWRQWLWTAMPARGSASWRVHRPRTGPPSFIVVTDLRFYDSYDYVFGDLKTRLRGDTLVSMLSFSLNRRVR